MARTSLTPFGYGADPFVSLQREMNRLVEDAFRGFGASPSSEAQGAGMVEARMNVSETEKELRVTAELPGVDEKDLDVSLDGDLLTIRGEKKFERESGGDKENYHFVERSYGSFQRSLRLPFQVDPGDVRAEFHNGVLTLTLPKSAQQQRSRKIQIGRGEQPAQISGEGMGRREPKQPERREPGTGEPPRAHH